MQSAAGGYHIFGTQQDAQQGRGINHVASGSA